MAGFQQAVFVTTAVAKAGFSLTDLPELVLAASNFQYQCLELSLAYASRQLLHAQFPLP